jgi:putative tryptophan/tyrosine transport system ATP-binding protein
MLEIRGANKTFNPGTPSEVQALSDVDLVIQTGTFVGIIGTNGSGKSTLLNAIAGSVGLDQGRIGLDGQDITGWLEHRRAALVGRVFQNPFAGTAPNMTLAENIVLATRRGTTRNLRSALPRSIRQEIRERIRGLGMGLEDRLDTPISTLSGGQRQALTLLMATWVRPHLLLLDEHTAALDPRSAAQVASLTKEIIHRDQLTALMVTHSMQQAVNLTDRIVMMHRGRILRDFEGQARQRVRTKDLMETFERARSLDQLDETAAEMLAGNYV